MRILIASDLHWPTVNGVATFGRNLAHGLAAAGHEVLVIAPSQTGKRYEEIDQNHRVIRTTSVVVPFYQNFRISLTPYREVKKIVEQFEPDVIHTQTPLGIGRAAVGAAKRYDIPLVATNHGMPENLIDNLRMLAPFARPIGYIIRDYGTRFYNNADFVTLPTEAAIHMLKNDSFHAPYMAISNGIDLSRFSLGKVPAEFYKRFGIPTDKPVALYVGRLDAEKHLWVLVKAVNHLLHDHDLHVVMVGHGNDQENLQNLTRELGIEDSITFTGRVEDKDLPVFYRLASIFAMPSPAELQSIATLEAMASGLPIVAVNVGALYELCQDEKNGYLFGLDDAHEMAEKLQKLLNDSTLRKKMAGQSLAIAKTHELSHTIDQFVKLYQHVLDMHAAEKNEHLDAATTPKTSG